MTRQMLAIFLLALVWFEPTALPAATKLTIGHSTINPRISPLWIAQEKGYFFTGWISSPPAASSPNNRC